ncbi:MAG: restriction endonuclease, SacI family [Planctomycetota bacterium]|nr:restriction endonuclease, SacI family [Planctomycetota bacterium]
MESIYAIASTSLNVTSIEDEAIAERVSFVCNCLANRAGVRLLMSCMLAKVHVPTVDPRCPYTEIGGRRSFSGRAYDERFIGPFISKYRLPCNSTTAFLTPTLRNHDAPLTLKVELIGRPRELYKYTVEILDCVSKGSIAAETVLVDAMRLLCRMRDENQLRMASLLGAIAGSVDSLPLSSEAIVTLLKQHLACKNSSRLPVLIVAAAYESAASQFGEVHLPLLSHNAADFQTGSLGDLEICLAGEDSIVTSYEMKLKTVTKDDIDLAVTKIARSKVKLDNYLFITTDRIDPDVVDYAAAFYEQTGGTEIAVLDCIGFIRHFLHFFHRVRGDFVDAYQAMLLLEPDSAVSQSLKEAFLALRKAAETDE